MLAGVVHGIGHYGNCFGVPTVGGEVYFEECYHTNPLVNAMSVGIVKVGKTVSATAEGIGNPVFFVGSAPVKMVLAVLLLHLQILLKKVWRNYRQCR